MWNDSADELVPVTDYGPTAAKLDTLGYRYELAAFEPCPATPGAAKCSPLFSDHLELAVNDQFAPAAAFLGSATVSPNPAHVTYEVDTARDRPTLGIVGDHAYWLYALTLRSQSHDLGRRPGGRDRRVLARVRGRRSDRVFDPDRARGADRRQPRPDSVPAHIEDVGPDAAGGHQRHDRHHRDQHRHGVDRRDPRPRRLQRGAAHHDRRADHGDAAGLQPRSPGGLRAGSRQAGRQVSAGWPSALGGRFPLGPLEQRLEREHGVVDAGVQVAESRRSARARSRSCSSRGSRRRRSRPT